MTTVATRAEGADSAAASRPADCLAAQRLLAHFAIELMQTLPTRGQPLADSLRLGASCLQLAGERAFCTQRERDAVRSWDECELGERQIRSATFQALRAGLIRTRDYDTVFRVASQAARARNDETLRLRRRLRQLAVI